MSTSSDVRLHACLCKSVEPLSGDVLESQVVVNVLLQPPRSDVDSMQSNVRNDVLFDLLLGLSEVGLPIFYSVFECICFALGHK